MNQWYIQMRIGLLIDYVISEYAERIIRGVSLACQEKSAELVVFSIGQLQNLNGAFDYQNVAVSSFVSSNNLDGAIFISGTIMHSLTKAEVASYIKSFNHKGRGRILYKIFQAFARFKYFYGNTGHSFCYCR